MVDFKGDPFLVAGYLSGSVSNWVESYSMKENKWEQRKSTPQKIYEHSAVTFQNYVYVFGE